MNSEIVAVHAKKLLNGNHDKYSVDIHRSKITVSILNLNI